MSEPAPVAAFRHVRLGILERRRRWGPGSGEPDAPLLWPGARGLLSQWLAGERAFVVASVAEDGRLGARALFSRSVIRRDLWHYGYLLTYPEFRRRGLGLAVMRCGLAIARKHHARRSACYVAEDNHPSRGLNEELGYRALPYVRLHVPAPDREVDPHLAVTTELASDVRRIADARPMLDALGEGEGHEVAVEEMLVRRPLLPWKQPDSVMVRIEQAGRLLAFARRGREVANVILRPGLSGLPLVEALASTGALLRRDGGIRHLFAFVPRAAVDATGKDLPHPYDRVYWLDGIAG